MPTTSEKPFYTTDQISDYLAEGFWADNFRKAPSLDVRAGDTVNVHLDLRPAGLAQARDALQAWSNVSGLHFREVAHAEDAPIRITDEPGRSYARPVFSSGHLDRTEVNVSRDHETDPDVHQFTFLHEIGHALGLGHAGDYNNSAVFSDAAHFSNDSREYTIMSYFSSANDGLTNPNSTASPLQALTPQVADIAAVHKLYGTPEIAMGDDIYGKNATREGNGMDLAGQGFTTLFDGGGWDVIDLRDFDADQVISLAPGTHSDLNGFKQNLSIAEGTVIEQLRLGGGNDRVTGSAADDHIEGGGGIDVIDGGLGFDTIHFDEDRDGFRIVFRKDGRIGVWGDQTDYDLLSNVELLSFAGGGRGIHIPDWVGEVTNGMIRDVAILYASHFDRLPEAEGLHFWVGAHAAGMALEDIAKEFHAVRLAEGDYDDSWTTTEFVEDAYQTVLGRAPALAGLYYWREHLDADNIDRETFINHLIEGAADGARSDRSYLDDIGSLAHSYAMHNGIWKVVDAERPLEVFGDQATSDLRGALAAVDDIAAQVLSADIGPTFILEEYREDPYFFM